MLLFATKHESLTKNITNNSECKSIKCNCNNIIIRDKYIKNLVVYLDKNLKWDRHIRQITFDI